MAVLIGRCQAGTNSAQVTPSSATATSSHASGAGTRTRFSCVPADRGAAVCGLTGTRLGMSSRWSESTWGSAAGLYVQAPALPQNAVDEHDQGAHRAVDGDSERIPPAVHPRDLGVLAELPLEAGHA
jgi:hypothetical protein